MAVIKAEAEKTYVSIFAKFTDGIVSDPCNIICESSATKKMIRYKISSGFRSCKISFDADPSVSEVPELDLRVSNYRDMPARRTDPVITSFPATPLTNGKGAIQIDKSLIKRLNGNSNVLFFKDMEQYDSYNIVEDC